MFLKLSEFIHDGVGQQIYKGFHRGICIVIVIIVVSVSSKTVVDFTNALNAKAEEKKTLKTVLGGVVLPAL
ncbi:hypothetical protein BPOR_1396g00010 [Botrytis porri]|uniref:Uncharacterized protein n=1 Tax=Botrytis porri TaxID=87229 RepID=A0A4Z1K4I7_9HELO|nr:hypothetical protein BPOR_1396g00010 [Botrytis porri]